MKYQLKETPLQLSDITLRMQLDDETLKELRRLNQATKQGKPEAKEQLAALLDNKKDELIYGAEQFVCWIETARNIDYDRVRKDKVNQTLLKFAGLILQDHRASLGDVEGADVEAYALECGLLERKRATAPCGENCNCALYADFPTDCNFPSELGMAALTAAQTPNTDTTETKS